MTIEQTLEAVGAYLETLTELSGIGVVVDKQQDMEEEMKHIQSKNKGYVITVGEISNRSPDEDAAGPHLSLNFGISVYSPKVVATGNKTGAELRTEIMRKLHHHNLEHLGHCYDEIFYLDGKTFVEENRNRKQFMVHAMKFKTRVRL